jgi:hypothetical protein
MMLLKVFILILGNLPHMNSKETIVSKKVDMSIVHYFACELDCALDIVKVSCHDQLIILHHVWLFT